MTNTLETITPRQLREILYYAADQNMTVKELREILFNIGEQDEEYTIDFALFHKLMKAAGRHEA